MLEDRDPEMSPNAEPKPQGPALAGASETPWTETYAKGVRVLRAARKPLDAMFGEPGSPTKLGRAMDATAEGLGVALMTHGAAATRLGGTRVLRKAGWQKGPFGWGVETRGDATLRPAAVFGAVREGRLGDVAYVHPDVAKAYPAMEDVPVKLVPAADWQRAVADARAMVREGSTGFSVRGGNGPIYIRGPLRGEDLGMFSERADRTLVHEMQHIAQDVDGVPGHAYARSNPGYATSAREVEARNSANRRWLTPDERIEMPRSMTQDVRPEDVHLDDKGGKKENYHRDFTNFLATDEVPETLFGYPVVQDERGYTESDLRFFQENPRAAGFYDTGEDAEETQEAWGGGDADEETIGLGGDALDEENAMKRFEAAGRVTERSVYDEVYRNAAEGLGAKFQYDRAMAERISKYDAPSQYVLNGMVERGEIGLEDVPIVRPGEPSARWTGAFMSAKAKNAAGHRGEYRTAGTASSHPDRNHVTEDVRISGKEDKWSREYDRMGRSAAYPGYSTVVVHNPGAAYEEFMHTVTRPYEGYMGSDAVAGLALKSRPQLGGTNLPYYAFGSPAERYSGMAVAKAAAAAAGYDMAKPGDRAKFMESLFGGGSFQGFRDLQAPANARGVLQGMKYIELKEKSGKPLTDEERKAKEDFGSDSLWKMVRNGGPETGTYADEKGGKTNG